MLGRERSRSQSSKAARASRWLLALALSGGALVVGASHTVTLCLVAIVVAASVVVGWWGAHPMKVRSAATVLLVTGVGLTAYTALQCVPWPIGALSVLAPHNADVWSRALAPLHEAGPSWAPITLDPPGTRIELLKGVVYLLVFVSALRVAQRRDGAAFLSGVVIVTGLLLALAAVLHPAFGAHKLYGIYEPGPGIAEAHIAPLMNPNNLAGYINIAFCLSLAAAWSREPRVPRVITATAVVLLAGTQVWVASRGGVIAMALGAIAVAGIVLSERARRVDARVWVTVGCGAATLVGGVFILLGSLDRAQNELFTADVTKFSALRDVARMIAGYGILGAGRGAFETAFPQFRTGLTYLRFVSPENVVAQWLTEWGVPVGLAGLTAIVVALRPTAAVVRSRTAAGAWAALAAIAVQNLADFGSEVPGVMLSATACAAIVVGGSSGLAPRWRFEEWSQRPTGVAKVAIAVAVLAVLGGAASVGRHVVDDRRRLHDAALASSTSLGVMHDLARTAMLRHPAEPYLPFITALRATRARDESPMPWLGATLERARVYGPAHLLLARVLTVRAPSQARLEYRLALEQAPELAGTVMLEAPRLVGGFDDAMELVGGGEAGAGMLTTLALTLTPRLPSTCVRLDEELSARTPADPSPSMRAADRAVADLSGGHETSWCQGAVRAACLDRALALAVQAEKAAPTTCFAYGLEANALAAAGATERALDRLDEVSDRVSDRVDCLRAAVALARKPQDDARFDKALAEIARIGCADEKQCVANLVWVAQMHEQRGNASRALAMYKRAYDAAPDDDALLESAARLAALTGMNAEALKDYQELARHHPGEPRWQRAAEEQHEAILRAAVKL
jgi:tetratricopeptide (TPR) repeat protein